MVTGLDVPWDLAFAPDGRLFVTERPGRIRVVVDGALQEAPFASLEARRGSEAGLMGIALDPAFAQNGFLYVCYSYKDPQGQPRNRVARLEDSEGVGTGHAVVVDGIPGADNHNGCRIRFGPDGKLYITTGDAQEAALAQALDSLAGKVLRVNPDGSVPADNPMAGSPVFTYGHRNPQGLDWHPVTGEAFITEHGPADSDGVNMLQAGRNYGWPLVRGIAGDPRYPDPVIAYTPTVALAGAAFYTGEALPAGWRGAFTFVTLKGSHLRRLAVSAQDHRGPPRRATTAS